MRNSVFPILVLAAACLLAGPARPGEGPLTADERAALDRISAPTTDISKAPVAPSAAALRRGLSATGEYYGLPFGDDLEKGYRALFAGDVDRALQLLADGRKRASGWSDYLVFRLSGIEADLLARTDRGPEAEAALERGAALEDEVWDQTWITETRRGEIQARLGEFAQAEGTLGRVAVALGDWQLPVEFSYPPPMTELILRTEAKFRAHLGLASLHVRSGDHARGQAWAGSTERHFRNLFTLADHPDYGSMVPLVPEFYIARGENLAYLGAAILVNGGDPAKAEPYFTAARGFFDAIGYAAGSAVTAALRAQALLDAGLDDAFLAHAPEATRLAVATGLHEIVWRIEGRRGALLLQLGDAPAAGRALRQAQASVELVSGRLSSDRAKLRFGVGKEEVTRLLAAIDAESGDAAALFRDLERGRARAFVDMLGRRDIASGREATAMAELKTLGQAIRAQRLANATAGSDIAAGVAREQALLGQWRERTAHLQDSDPDLAETLSIGNRELADIQQALAPGQVLLYVLPAAPEQALRILEVTADETRIIALSASGETLSDYLLDFADAVDARHVTYQQRAAELLSDALRTESWSASELVYVVPSGAAFQVPWGALSLEAAVVVLPTGGWLLRGPTADDVENEAVVVGDPSYGGRFPQLPGARAEAERIATLYGTAALIGGGATLPAIRSRAAARVGVLHLATHGLFDREAPLQSSVILSDGEAATRLTAADIFAHPLPAGLVVLSACETGMGHGTAGDDYLGLVRSFYLGGARGVLNSLWPIEDEGTRFFMERFHATARDGDYAAAWRQARDAAKASGYPPAVYGAFILGGAASAEGVSPSLRQ